ncbi:MAG TPA: hypothetical protein VGG74_06635 [Kofleriaceae bacterium]
MQVAGDCKIAQCDGSGNVVEDTDDSDVPAASGPCVITSCSNGEPSMADAASGTTCGNSLVCDGAGQCVGCISAAECPGSDTECETRTCIGNTCGIDYQIEGTVLANQVAGDCEDLVCDGSGGTEQVVDDSDTPSGSACTTGSCNNGFPTQTPAGSGTPCGSDFECDGSGNCGDYCGNGVALGSEDCDGSDLQSQTCAGLGFTAGTLACSPTCTFDTSGCTTCGNGEIEAGEACDGTQLGSATCVTQGFAQGQLACSPTCTFDTSGCSTCGDGIISGTEVCDGANVGTATCESLGDPPGLLGCAADCESFDTSQCTGGWIAANTSFTGTVCADGLRYGPPGNPFLAVCTIDNGAWLGTVVSASPLPLHPIPDPIWSSADGTTVSSLTGTLISILDLNSKVSFLTSNTSGANFFLTSQFTSASPTWTAPKTFAQYILAYKLGGSSFNYWGGWDPTSGQAVTFHGTTGAPTAVTLGAGITGTITSIASGDDLGQAAPLDLHYAVNGLTASSTSGGDVPTGTAGAGAGIYWSCDGGATFTEDDGGITDDDKPLVYKIAPDKLTYVNHTAMTPGPRTCPTNMASVTTYASTMYAALLGGSSIYKTVDGGATWAASNTGLPANVEVFAIAIDCGEAASGATTAQCANDNLLYAATSTGIYRSTDAGAHWAIDGLEGSVVRAVAIEAEHPVATITATPNGATETGNTATFTINGMILHVGDAIVITAVGAGYDGTWTVASVISSTQFTVTLPTSGLAGSGGGTVYLVTPRVFAATDQANSIFQTNVPVYP